MIKLIAKKGSLQKFDQEIPFNNFEEVINYLYKNYTGVYYGTTEKTYNINDNNKKLIRGRRSINSIYKIVKYYFPKTTNKEFFNYLKNLVNNDKLVIHYCPDIKHFVCVQYDESTFGSVSKTYDNSYNVFNRAYGVRIEPLIKVKNISYDDLISTFVELDK